MQSKCLIDTAVFESSQTASFANRLFALSFSRLVYTQSWEDPQVDIEALQLAPGANIVTISSGGCNPLAYLTTKPAAVYAVDLNEAHLAMLQMKLIALQRLPTYELVLDYLGRAQQQENVALYKDYIRPHLDAGSLAFWETKPLFGQPRYSYFAHHAYQQGLLGKFIGFSHALTRLLGGNLAKLAQARSMAEQTELFEKYLAPVFEHAIIRFLAKNSYVLYCLGIPPSQFKNLQQAANGHMHHLFKERMRHLACDFPLQENCFAGQAFARQYDSQTQTALPMYLQQKNYHCIQTHLDKIIPQHATLTSFMRSQPTQSLHAYSFLDVQDWMSQSQLIELWEQVTRTAAPNARVVFRTGGTQSPLESQLPAHLLMKWRTDQTQNKYFYARDRSAIYGAMHIYQKIDSTN